MPIILPPAIVCKHAEESVMSRKERFRFSGGTIYAKDFFRELSLIRQSQLIFAPGAAIRGDATDISPRNS